MRFKFLWVYNCQSSVITNGKQLFPACLALRPHLRPRIRNGYRQHIRGPAHQHSPALCRTPILTQEAISYYSSLIAQLSVQPDFDPSALAKRTKFYQEKIKRLLVRTDVQQCLVGKKRNPKGLDLQKELAKVSLHAPEQARALLNHYTSHLKQQ